MRPSQRHDEIISILNRDGESTVEELAEMLRVSRETIRRDLSKLDESGRLRKFHGGARISSAPNGMVEEEGPFAIRMMENLEAKRRIASIAAGLLKPGDAIFIDTGSTTVVMAEELARLKSLVVVTNSPRIAATVSANPTHKVFLIGGAYGRDAGESLGPFAIEQIAKFHANHAIITIGGIDAHSVMDFDLQEAQIAKAMIDRADKVIVLADHTKLDKRAIFEVAPLSQIHTVVTDRALPSRLAAALADAGTGTIVA